MAEYLRITNDNQVTVIDDKYLIPKLLGRWSFSIDTVLPVPPNIKQIRFFRPYWKFQGGMVFKRANTLRELGFDYDTTVQNANMISNKIMVFGRSIGSNAPFEVFSNVGFTSNNDCYISVSGRSDTQFLNVEFAVYAFDVKLMPSKFGVHAFSEDGTLIFDAMRGTMQNIGILEGSLNMGQSVARTYTIPTPDGLDSNNIFISFRSRPPYYAGYDYSSSGVRMDDAFYVPRMTINPTNVVVQLVRTSSVGKSTAYSFGGYFENVVYVPQKQGTYL